MSGGLRGSWRRMRRIRVGEGFRGGCGGWEGVPDVVRL
jgi:hypothetical protein